MLNVLNNQMQSINLDYILIQKIKIKWHSGTIGKMGLDSKYYNRML